MPASMLYMYTLHAAYVCHGTEAVESKGGKLPFQRSCFMGSGIWTINITRGTSQLLKDKHNFDPGPTECMGHVYYLSFPIRPAGCGAVLCH